MYDSSQPIVDRERFGQAKAELGANFQRIVGYFREDGEKAIAEIEAAMERGSATALVRPAHTLKGESLQFGAEQLGLTAEAIEKAARSAIERHDFPHHVGSDVAMLRPLFQRSLAFFEAEFAAGSSAAPRRNVGFGRKVA